MSEEEAKAIKELNHYINITEYWKQKEYTNSEIDHCIKILLNLVEKQQKEIERLNGIINSRYYHDLQCRELEIEINENWQDKIKGKLKKLEEQKEKMRFDGDVCFADYEQFYENLKFFKEQIGELLEEN